MMEFQHYLGYIDRMEDLGEQILDIVAEMRADPPRGWPVPGFFAVPVIGVAVDVPKKEGATHG